ncbi:hypothetical protein FAES_3233 [Fibrella aestuarina BUZ 2]|uniref:Uncharacterized protein n=1 Tax=Fibrella aestuarina BUZ 2 TaxID=1166018 RepID=I0KAT9_9BACT|nr:hypothetical protein [Fibrella aestuarina]CCH01242.1 hypothetical protein FAES_3233 [Fibrella aestuarina BUZ 2]
MQVTINTADPQALASAWPLLSDAQRQSLIDNGTIDIVARAINNASADWMAYSGRVDIESCYRHKATDVIVASCEPAVGIPISAATCRKIAMLVLNEEPDVLTKLVEQCHGTMPTLWDPDAQPVVD